MSSASLPRMPERYVLEDDRYVLYLGSSRALSTDVVAVLIDIRLPMLITHGDPASVRRELDEMRAVLRTSCAPRYERDWLLLEGRPDLDWLNRALAQPGRIDGFGKAFAHSSAPCATDIARRLLERVSRRD